MKLPKALEARMNELINDAPKNASHEIGREQGFRAAASILLEGGDELAEALNGCWESIDPDEPAMKAIASWNKLKEGVD